VSVDLFVIRHAIAEDRRAGLEEHQRALTPEGRAKFELVVAGMRRMGLRFGNVLYSPLIRAKETAEMLKPLAAGKLIETDLLANTPGAELLELLTKHPGAAVVGHRPWLGELISLLVNGEVPESEQYITRKGGLAALSGKATPGGMVLAGLYPARDLRLIGSEAS